MVSRDDDASAVQWTSSRSCLRLSDLLPRPPACLVSRDRTCRQNVYGLSSTTAVVLSYAESTTTLCRSEPRGVDDRRRLSLTSTAESGRRRRTASLVVDVYGRKQKASTDGVTCRWRLRLKAEGVDGRCYLTTTAEGRRRRRTVLLVADDYR